MAFPAYQRGRGASSPSAWRPAQKVAQDWLAGDVDVAGAPIQPNCGFHIVEPNFGRTDAPLQRWVDFSSNEGMVPPLLAVRIVLDLGTAVADGGGGPSGSGGSGGCQGGSGSSALAPVGPLALLFASLAITALRWCGAGRPSRTAAAAVAKPLTVPGPPESLSP